MKIIAVNGICTMYSQIIVSKTCPECNGTGKIDYEDTRDTCFHCLGDCETTDIHTVSNHGWLPLEWWIKKFEGM